MWLQHIVLDWKSISAVYAKQSSPRGLESLFSTYADVFKEELDTVQPMKAKLHVKPDARSKLCRPRSVPFAVKGVIEQKLARLESSGIIKKVPCSDWAAPIVAEGWSIPNLQRLQGDH